VPSAFQQLLTSPCDSFENPLLCEYGVNAYLVEVETHIENMIPGFIIVGLPDGAVKESRERITAAIKNSNLAFTKKKITVNLAPADIKKEGSAYDLPMAIGILASTEQVEPTVLDEFMIVGELALDGA
jgi:magnesium chelatase family protein